MAESTSSKAYSSDPTLWLYTSLSSGSSQIVTATSRLETILKANRIPFKALDVATDEKARMLWGRRAGKRKLPGLVRMGMVVGDIDEVEEWNEYGELKEQVGADTAPIAVPATTTTTKASTTTSTAANPVPVAPSLPTAETITSAQKASSTQPAAVKPASSISFAPEKPRSEQTSIKGGPGGAQASMSLTMRQLGQEAAARAKQNKSDALSARKAQLEAAEKPADQVDTTSKGTKTISADTPETTQQDLTSITEQKLTETNKENVKPGEALDGISDSKPNTSSLTNSKDASEIEAIGPESPLPATEEPIAEPQNTTAIESLPTKSSESVISESSIPVSLANIASPNTAYTTHRGSSISAASKEEIKEIEEANKIPEEPEEEEEVESVTQTDKQEQTIPVTNEESSEKKDGIIKKQNIAKLNESSSATTSTTKSNSQSANTEVDSPVVKDASINSTTAEDTSSQHVGSKTQEQAAAEPNKAVESVED